MNLSYEEFFSTLALALGDRIWWEIFGSQVSHLDKLKNNDRLLKNQPSQKTFAGRINSFYYMFF